MDIYNVNTVRVVVYDEPVRVVGSSDRSLRILVFPGELRDGEIVVGELVDELDVECEGCFVDGERVGDFACVFPVPRFMDGDKFNCDIVIHCRRLSELCDDLVREIVKASSGVPIVIDRTSGCSVVDKLAGEYGFVMMDI